MAITVINPSAQQKGGGKHHFTDQALKMRKIKQNCAAKSAYIHVFAD